MNPAIAKVIRDMSVRDGTLSSALTVNKSDYRGDNQHVVPGGKNEQVHPIAGSRPNQSAGHRALMAVRAGRPASTGPTQNEAMGNYPRSLTQTTGEKGIDPQMLIQMLMQLMEMRNG